MKRTKRQNLLFIVLLFAGLTLQGCGTEVGNPGDAPEEDTRTGSPSPDEVQETSADIPQASRDNSDEDYDSSHNPESATTSENPASPVTGEEDTGNETMSNGSLPACDIRVTSSAADEGNNGTIRFLTEEGINTEITGPDGTLYENPDEPFTNISGVWTIVLKLESKHVCRVFFTVNESNVDSINVVNLSYITP